MPCQVWISVFYLPLRRSPSEKQCSAMFLLVVLLPYIDDNVCVLKNCMMDYNVQIRQNEKAIMEKLFTTYCLASLKHD